MRSSLKTSTQCRWGTYSISRTRTQTFTYRVTGTDIVNPTDVYVMADTGRPTVTLISCYPYRVNNKRYVVFADRIDDPGA
ncbi:MAG: sortase [Chloroflexi bacterium]|nr:sortase [Chloroflexota bacterium]